MKLTPELLLSAYAQGVFPMASSRDSQGVRWYDPPMRGIIPLAGFHVPKSLAKFARKAPYTITLDAAFREVMTACADTPRGHESGTWINDEIIDAYCELHALGYAHSVEVWEIQNESQEAFEPSAREAAHHADASRRPAGAIQKLVGGLYGVSLGRAFFGESMFSHAPNASKLALVFLVERLIASGYELLDTQYINEHLLQFGAVEIPREEYHQLLKKALS